MTQNIKLETVSVGVAKADITPPVGTPSAGFAGREALSELHDPLLATTMIVSDGVCTAGLLACDLLYLDAETVGEIRGEVRQRTGIAEADLTIACTHTHYGPVVSHERPDPRVHAYRANLVHILSGVVEEAARKMQPAHMGVGWGTSHIGVNRREKRADGRVVLGQNPAGPIDRAVGVLRVETPEGEPIACLVNFQTHPVSQTGKVSHISADYPGKAGEIVKGMIGARCMFLQGASGNINAAIMEPHYEPARTLGTRLGCEIVRVWETIQTKPISGLRVESAPIQFPRIRYGSQDKAQELVRSLQEQIEQFTAEDTPQGRLIWANRRLEKAQRALESWTTGVPLEPVETELQAWRIGDWALVAAPGEIFNQIGVQVKQGSPFADTFFVGYANDSIGYIPVPEAYADGGYEVDHASQVDPQAAGLLSEGCLQLLHKLAR